MEGHRKFLGGGGIWKAKILKEKNEAKLEFLVGRGCKTKTFQLGGGVWIFLQLHIQH